MDEFFLLPQMDTNFKYIKNVNSSFNHIKDVLLRSKELYKRHADKKRLEPPAFKEGDLVWVQTPPSLNIEDNSKFSPCKYGPYKALEALDNNNYKNYKIDLKRSPFLKHHPVFHISELDSFIPTPAEYIKTRSHD